MKAKTINENYNNDIDNYINEIYDMIGKYEGEELNIVDQKMGEFIEKMFEDEIPPAVALHKIVDFAKKRILQNLSKLDVGNWGVRYSLIPYTSWGIWKGEQYVSIDVNIAKQIIAKIKSAIREFDIQGRDILKIYSDFVFYINQIEQY